MANIIHRVGIKAKVQDVYKALSTIEGLAGWWTQETSGVSKENGEIDFCFKDPSGDTIGEMKMKVRRLVPGKTVEWKCMDGPPDWVGTDFSFELSQEEDYVIVLFGHRNWEEETESMAHCSQKWSIFLMSLKELVETGRGRPSPNDIKIDNWN